MPPEPRGKLYSFLEACGVETRINKIRKPWGEASARTRKSHVVQAKDVVVSSMRVMMPGDEAQLWGALASSRLVEKELGIDDGVDGKYLSALAEAYHLANGWETRREILSVMADLVPFKRLKSFIPGLTEYLFLAAWRHKKEFGRGAPRPAIKQVRVMIEEKQLDHFLDFITSPHIVQDLPFGLKHLCLFSGEILETPNVIRNMIRERIVRQYQSYCEESGFKHSGRTTMLAILSACSATVRKSLQGLDYVAAEGSSAISSRSCKTAERLNRALRKIFKNVQLKAVVLHSFQIHVSASSPVADHCSTWALSDSRDRLFREDCDHQHDFSCRQCEDLSDVIAAIKVSLEEDILPFIEDQLIDLRHRCGKAAEDIQLWKAHLLRSNRQDAARIKVIADLDESSVLITDDWAMKFLPKKYRESQTDWFAKRGISWHISVVARKNGDEVQTQTFVHIARNCNQDASAVVHIVEHVLRTIKSKCPEIKKGILTSGQRGLLPQCGHTSRIRRHGEKNWDKGRTCRFQRSTRRQGTVRQESGAHKGACSQVYQ
ncbi:uncharacterized protein LOC116609386 [Nematostella vectensis]|uniref:uncharacterized protein LOC116609386 n=1 Tax=Nematostella vectensis TaxID=45351 RepID=UPI00207709F7|nr:uncharacterized protein LOC116609386 [Nematostella vectensis]